MGTTDLIDSVTLGQNIFARKAAVSQGSKDHNICQLQQGIAYH